MKYVFDIESDGLLDSIQNIWVLVIQDIDTGEQYAYSDHDSELDSLRSGIERLATAELLIGHNIIGFDIPAIRMVSGVDLLHRPIHDTWVLSQCLQYKRSHKHGLNGWGEHLGDSKLDYNDWSGYNKEMLTYCRQDVALNAKVYKQLLKEYSRIYKYNPLIQKGLRDEMDVAKLNSMMRDQGWNFDMDKAYFTLSMYIERMDQIESIVEPKLGTTTKYIDKEPKTPKFKKDGTYQSVTCRLLSEYFGYEIKPTDTHLMPAGSQFQRKVTKGIDLGQISLVKEWLLDNGWKPREYTKKKINGKWVTQSPKIDEASLKEFGRDGELISEYYTLRNRRSVLEGWLEKVKDGRLHGNMWTIGTPSFRCRHETIVNLPAVTAAYGKPLRQMLAADEGDVIVGCDSAGNQLRGLCHFVDNDDFTREVIYGDQHQRNADILGCSRPVAKTYLYAYLFGAGDYKLGQTLGGGKELGAESKEKFGKGIKGLGELKARVEGEWLDHEARQGVGWIKGLDGRPVFIDSEHQVLNYLLQSTEGITCKAAFAWQWRKIREEGLRAKPRIFYHDESAWSVHPDDAHRVGQILKESFEEAPKEYGVMCMEGGDYCIGESYADVH